MDVAGWGLFNSAYGLFILLFQKSVMNTSVGGGEHCFPFKQMYFDFLTEAKCRNIKRKCYFFYNHQMALFAATVFRNGSAREEVEQRRKPFQPQRCQRHFSFQQSFFKILYQNSRCYFTKCFPFLVLKNKNSKEIKNLLSLYAILTIFCMKCASPVHFRKTSSLIQIAQK